MKSIKNTFFLLFISILPCAAQESNSQQPWITVFVHGNYGAAWIALDFDNVLKDNCEGSWYKKLQTWARIRNLTHKKMRDPRLYPALGLHQIEIDNPLKENNKDPIPYALAKTYQDVTTIIDPHQASNSAYYSFGWNGILSQTARRQEAIVFYQALSQEIETYKTRGLNPKIRLICHSHGGNVALNMGGINAVLNKEQFLDSATSASLECIAQELKNQCIETTLDSNLCVDELIILATPIQKETEGFAASRFFKKVLTGYSNNDFTQIIDGLSTNAPMSKRTIPKQKLGPNTNEIHFSVVNHQTTAKPKLIPSFIKKNLRAYTQQAIETFVKYAKVQDYKTFDLQALDDALKKIQRNMQEHPDDPSHGDFFNAKYQKKQQLAQTLPLFVWMPLVYHLLQKLNCFAGNQNNELHVTFHYYDEKITIVAETATEEKNLVVPEKIVLYLKKKFFGYLINIEDKSDSFFDDFLIDA